ncbi:MAG: VCBS repeat-containing protein [Kiritimatiellae bacterium]|nr:VCBS repeat-containing protein [Kiritimatiellia bacterium]
MIKHGWMAGVFSVCLLTGAQGDLPQEMPLYYGWSEALAAPADYDGDGKGDPALYYPEQGAWFIWSSLTGEQSVRYWGWNEALPMPADFDGDGKADLCVYYPDAGGWYVLQSRDQQPLFFNWGWNEAQPIPLDYDGNGKTDFAVYYPLQGMWCILPLSYPPVEDINELRQMYSNAVLDAHQPTAEKISRNLIAITEDNTSLLWSNGAVCMTSYTDWSGYTNYIGQNYTLSASRELWVTASTQMKAFCASYRGNNIRLRTCQYLGLPPEKTNAGYVVEFMVDPRVMFRPSPDPEITDTQAELTLRTNSQFQSVSPNHVAWIQYNIASNSCPWTSLGYTYDWAPPPNSNIGGSEFVVRTGSTVFVRGVYAIESYGTTP